MAILFVYLFYKRNQTRSAKKMPIIMLAKTFFLKNQLLFTVLVAVECCLQSCYLLVQQIFSASRV